MYGSTQTHSLGAKAGLILGLPFRALPVHAKDGYALRGETLAAAIAEDTAKGLVPFFVSEWASSYRLAVLARHCRQLLECADIQSEQ